VSIYAAAFSRAGINTADSVYANLWNAGSTRIKLFEVAVGIAVAPTTAPLLYLVRTSARGTQTATLAGQALDPADAAAAATVDSTWSANPTKAGAITAAGIVAGGLAVTAGGLLVWQFYDEPLVLAAGAGLAIANVNASGATTGTFAGHFKWRE
jgi:hypothetical protein